MEKEKQDWLKSIGAVDFYYDNFRWYVPECEMYYSEEYIKNTPLEELKAKYKNHLIFHLGKVEKRKPIRDKSVAILSIIISLVALIRTFL